MKRNILTRLFSGNKNRPSTEMQYLNGSVSIYDLERRQREVERGLFR
jgi:hypothetical protein